MLLLDLVAPFQDLAQPLQAHTTPGEMHGHQPGTHEVDEVMQHVGVGDAVDCRTDSEEEEQ